jgi:hypothetical protein
MIGIDTIGLANTAGVEAKLYPVIPPIQRVHQEGIVDTILVAYDEPESGEMIPVGRVVTSPVTMTVGEQNFVTSSVMGLVGDGIIYEQLNQINKQTFAKEQADKLVKTQEAAAAIVLGHFGYDIRRKRASNVFSKILRQVR